MAGDISYTHISGNQYQIKVRTFTNTVGTSADRCEIVIYFGDSDSAIVPRSNGPAGSCNAPAKMGIAFSACSGAALANEYTVIHTYPGNGIYTLRVDDPNRSAGILNIMNSVNTTFHLEAELIISSFWGGNSSPVMNNTPIVCSPVNAPYNYNPGAVDGDGDSLYYENFLRGSIGYSDPVASNTFYIDSLTGNVIWDLPTTIGPYVYDIKITQWKKIGGTYYYAGMTTQEVWTNITAMAGINENNNENALNVYPNPCSEIINFQLENIPKNNCRIIISDTYGKMLRNIEIKEKMSFSVTTEELSSGMYFYELINAEKSLSKGKFLIIKGF
jgi:hypothetical protein